MSLEDEITALNSAYASQQAAAAKAAKEEAEAKELNARRKSILSNEGPQFIMEIHNLLAPRARTLSEKVHNPAQKLVVGYGHSSRQVFISTGGPLLANEVRLPCAFVELSDYLDRLTMGTWAVGRKKEAEEIYWRPNEGKIEVLHGGKPQSLSDFVDGLIGTFLRSIQPRGY